LFAQATYNSKIANITAGVRYDDHSAVDAAFVPRIALTKVVNDWHFKLLYSQAFKTPVIENVNLNPSIKPERIEVAEFETGYRLNENMFLTANLFYTKIKDVIVYSEDEIDGDFIYGYQNYPNSGTHGFEVDYKYKGKWGFINASYSYYKANKNVDVEAYRIAGNDRLFLGFPGHKFATNAHIKLVKNLYLNPGLIFFSEKYYYEYDADWELALNKIDNLALLNINLTYQNLLTEGLDLGVGVYNIGSANDMYAQPYNGGSYPVLAPGREVNFNLKYRFGF
jgi:outer membrane receptor protein involved in Fe transport